MAMVVLMIIMNDGNEERDRRSFLGIRFGFTLYSSLSYAEDDVDDDQEDGADDDSQEVLLFFSDDHHVVRWRWMRAHSTF